MLYHAIPLNVMLCLAPCGDVMFYQLYCPGSAVHMQTLNHMVLLHLLYDDNYTGAFGNQAHAQCVSHIAVIQPA